MTEIEIKAQKYDKIMARNRANTIKIYHKRHTVTEDMTDEQKEVILLNCKERNRKQREKYPELKEYHQRKNREYYHRVIKPKREAEKARKLAEKQKEEEAKKV